MATPPRDNIAGRVFNDLRNTARKQRRGTDELIVMYVLERWLYRMSTSPYHDQFILKGGLLLSALDARRPTRDGDLLAAMDNDEAVVVARVKEIASIDADDGVAFGINKMLSNSPQHSYAQPNIVTSPYGRWSLCSANWSGSDAARTEPGDSGKALTLTHIQPTWRRSSTTSLRSLTLCSTQPRTAGSGSATPESGSIRSRAPIFGEIPADAAVERCCVSVLAMSLGDSQKNLETARRRAARPTGSRRRSGVRWPSSTGGLTITDPRKQHLCVRSPGEFDQLRT